MTYYTEVLPTSKSARDAPINHQSTVRFPAGHHFESLCVNSIPILAVTLVFSHNAQRARNRNNGMRHRADKKEQRRLFQP
ncbi:hypothetical protein WN51_03899 [Melipona quadrifasciata]|uniref:Uncharacterized protein n=1 Tax=Melipona quadrifasciata TaxID=166423 RepID=A0A0M8ZRY1_9HYME|nr:hypothetical protein WN51_03899 [Melipona quadrifasciata]